MRTHRTERLSSLLREELAFMFARDIELPGFFVTVTDVLVSDDHSHAVVRVSFLPSEGALKAFKQLEKELPRFEHVLWRKLNIRPMPHLSLEVDHGPENAARVEKALLEDNNKER